MSKPRKRNPWGATLSEEQGVKKYLGGRRRHCVNEVGKRSLGRGSKRRRMGETWGSLTAADKVKVHGEFYDLGSIQGRGGRKGGRLWTKNAQGGKDNRQTLHSVEISGRL